MTQTIYQSETSKHRDILESYCTGCGIDIGFGGDPITESAIRMDFPQPYANTGTATVQLGGDSRILKWFRDDVLDYVYSSHVLEDFDEQQTVSVLAEWLRVVRVGGYLVLLLPDQARYVAYCEGKDLSYNYHHSIPHFSLDYVRGCLDKLNNSEEAARYPALDEYSFALVVKKTVASNAESAVVEALEKKLERALRENDELQITVNRLHNHPLLRATRTLSRIVRRR